LSMKNKTISGYARVLGLKGSFTPEDVENSFRKLAIKYHPDRCRDSRKTYCRKKFSGISNARVVLNRYLAEGLEPAPAPEKKAVRKYRKHVREYREHIDRFYTDWFCIKEK